MPPFFIRSTIFNILFYALTGISCVFLLPTLFFPRNIYLFTVRFFVFTADILAKTILGLSYEVRGVENLPQEGPFIIAAKHQSAYETLKLHILFDDPAVVLKKELLKIPLWGRYLKKSDVIAIDRSTPKAAIKSIQDGARRMAEQKRPIVIFPQGTRVSIDQSAKEKPYKVGVLRIQEATGIPVIPLALNTGFFWPKNSWTKKPGTVVFEFLPSLKIEDDAGETLKNLEKITEEKSRALLDEAKQAYAVRKSKGPILLILTSLALIAAYCANWYIMSDQVKKYIAAYLADIEDNPQIRITGDKMPIITGFPGKIKVSLGPHIFSTVLGDLSIQKLEAQSWPVPYFPITIGGKIITVQMQKWGEPLSFETLDGTIKYTYSKIKIENAFLKNGQFEASVSGEVATSRSSSSAFDLIIQMKNHEVFLQELTSKKIVKRQPALLAAMALQALKKGDIVTVHLKTYEDGLYLGPLKIMSTPQYSAPPGQSYPARERPVMISENPIDQE